MAEQTTRDLPPIGPCVECGIEIDYGQSYTVTKDLRLRHTSCTEERHWTDGEADYGHE